MNALIFTLLFSLSTILFIYGLHKWGLEGATALAISGVIWLALSLASFVIEFPYVLVVNNTIQTYVYRDYSTASSYLFAGLGILSLSISMIKFVLMVKEVKEVD